MGFSKKVLAVVLVIAFVFTMLPMEAMANDAISVTIDGHAVDFEDQEPIMVNNRVLIPVRFVFRDLGFEIDWNRSTRVATLVRDDFVIVITVGSTTFTVNGANHALDVPAEIIGGRIMTPLGPILRALGYELDWVGGTRTVVIETVATEEVAADPVDDAADNPADDEADAPTDEADDAPADDEADTPADDADDPAGDEYVEEVAIEDLADALIGIWENGDSNLNTWFAWQFNEDGTRYFFDTSVRSAWLVNWVLDGDVLNINNGQVVVNIAIRGDVLYLSAGDWNQRLFRVETRSWLYEGVVGRWQAEGSNINTFTIFENGTGYVVDNTGQVGPFVWFVNGNAITFSGIFVHQANIRMEDGAFYLVNRANANNYIRLVRAD